MARRRFENEWKDAFDQAEVKPSDNLWTNIELDLEKAEGSSMKKRILYYKLMAAASLFFAMLLAGAYVYTSNIKNDQVAVLTNQETSSIKNLNDEKENQSIEIKKDEPSLNGSDKKQNAETPDDQKLNNLNNIDLNNNLNNGDSKVSDQISTLKDKVIEKNKTQEITISSKINNKSNQLPDYADNTNNNIIALTNQSDQKTDVNELVIKGDHLPNLYSIQKVELILPEKSVDPFEVMMAKLEQREMELGKEDRKDLDKKKQRRAESLWTSVGVAGGSFSATNTNINSASPALATSLTSSNSTIAKNESKASGNSYIAGLSMGTKISERWLIQGGVNYLSQTSSYQANAVLGSTDLSSFRAASIYQLSEANSDVTLNKYIATAPYYVNNNLQFVSIPVQAGYIAIDHKVALQINAGVSTDLFMQNTMTPQADGLDKVTQGRGSESPYRPVNFSGLIGTELSYRLGKHYRLAVNPGLRYPINSIYKSEIGVASNPVTMNLGMHFRYFFR